MMKRLDGEQVPFRTAADRRALVGKAIRYLRDCDIDKSGRGYFFPRFDVVVAAHGKHLIFGNGSSVAASELREVVLVGAPTMERS